MVSASPGDGQVEIVVDATLPTDGEQLAFLLNGLVGYDAAISRVRGSRTVRELFEIRSANAVGGSLMVVVMIPPLARLRIEVGDRVEIEFDAQLSVQWAWTGWHRISGPNVDAFDVYVRSDRTDAIIGQVSTRERDGDTFVVEVDHTSSGPAVGAANLIGRSCLIDGHRYQIRRAVAGPGTWTLTLKYLARPIVQPETGTTAQIEVADGPSLEDIAGWPGAEKRVPIGVLPEVHAMPSATVDLATGPELDSVRDAFPGISIRGLLKLEVPRPEDARDDEPPGAVIGFSLAAFNYGYRALRVIAHLDNDAGVRTLYLKDEAFKGAPPAGMQLRRVRYFRGVWIDDTVHVKPDLAEDPTRLFRVGITALRRARDTGSVLNSALCRLAQTVAVNRRRPPAPPQPTVVIEPAQFSGVSVANISWITAPSAEVHRATDVAVFANDLLMRRTRTGAYSAELRPAVEEVFGDDLSFAEWLVARFPDFTSDWRTTLFGPKPIDDTGPDVEALAGGLAGLGGVGRTVLLDAKSRRHPRARAVAGGRVRFCPGDKKAGG